MRISISTPVLAFLCVMLAFPGLAQKKRVLHSVRAENIFSSAMEKDVFLLTLSGRDTLNGTLVFRILSPKKKTLLLEKLSADDLIGFGPPEVEEGKEVPPHRMSQYIIERMNGFFAEDNFLVPAISPGEEFNLDYCAKPLWDEIRGLNRAVGFHYLLGKEDNRFIAYSVRKKKAVLYKTHD